MSIRLFHISDLHLDCQFKTKKPELAKYMRDAQHRVFEKAIEKALDYKCHIFAFVGDVLHGQTMTFKTEEVLYNGISRLLNKGVYVIYLTGNHDYIGLQRSLKSFLTHPYFLYFSTPNPTSHCVEIEGLSVRIIGCGHDEKGIVKNCAQFYPKGLPGEISLGFYHGMVLGETVHEADEEPYMACGLSDLEDKGYHYFGLGHIHKRQALSRTIAYAGALQGMRKSENQKKGGLLVEIDEIQTIMAFVPLSEIEFRTVSLRLTHSEQSLTLYRLLKNALLEVMGHDTAQYIFNVNLMGSSNDYDKIIQEDFVSEFINDFNQERLLDLELDCKGLSPAHLDVVLNSHYMQIALQALENPMLSPEFLTRIDLLELSGIEVKDLLESDKEQLKNEFIHYFAEV